VTDSDVPPSAEQDPSVPPAFDSMSAPFAGQLCVPKLRASQVFIWLALAAVLIGLDYAMSVILTREIANLPLGSICVVLPWWIRPILPIYIASLAACLVASGILMRSGCLQMLNRLQPGHWIVLILAVSGILRWVTRPFDVLGVALPSPFGWKHHAVEAILWLEFLTVGILFAFAAIWLRDSKPWKVLLAFGSANAIFFAVPLLLSSMILPNVVVQAWLWAHPWWPAVCIVIALVAVFIDWPRRATRDWLHWLGVSVWVLGCMASQWMFIGTRIWMFAGH
jgi:hypothetical protein